MQLEKIISVSGKPGLYKLISQLRNGFIIEDISTGKKSNISNTSQVSLLDNIAMYTLEQEVPLFEVFENIAKKEDFKATINHKSSEKELREFMDSALPNYDSDRVYISDIKKLSQWYNILHASGYITPESFVKESTETPAETEEKAAGEEKEAVEAKPAKKAAPKKEKTVTPQPKASTSAAKSAPKSTHRKQG